jgi:hypothetical protein
MKTLKVLGLLAAFLLMFPANLVFTAVEWAITRTVYPHDPQVQDMLSWISLLAKARNEFIGTLNDLYLVWKRDDAAIEAELST